MTVTTEINHLTINYSICGLPQMIFISNKTHLSVTVNMWSIR